MTIALLVRRVLIAACLTAVAGENCWGEETPGNAALQREIERLIGKLDADKFATRQDANNRLIEIGRPAIPQLLAAQKSDSLEQRIRARTIATLIEHRDLAREFTELAGRQDEQIDLDRGMWLISRLLRPEVQFVDIDRQFDMLADNVHRKIGAGVDLQRLPPREAVEKIVNIVFDPEEGFSGNQTDYDNPDNSSIERVLATRKGLPILLSHVLVSVAQRLDVPIVGLQVPGRYMVKYEGSRAPAGQPQDDIVVDPYGGTVLSIDEVKQVVPSFDPEQHLLPSSRRATLSRMLLNLINDLEGVGRHEVAQRGARYKAILDAEPPKAATSE